MPRGVPNKPKAPATDVVGQMAAQKLLQDTYGAGAARAAAIGVDPEKATVWTPLKDTSIATHASGPILIRSGQEVASPILLNALREAGAHLVPVR
jgi:hypothetical protein